VGLELEEKVHSIDQEEDLKILAGQKNACGQLTTLVPRLTFNTELVALVAWSLLKEAWKAV
jgi:hypothetical protein